MKICYTDIFPFGAEFDIASTKKSYIKKYYRNNLNDKDIINYEYLGWGTDNKVRVKRLHYWREIY
jgi:hypothetical protein